jgi:eukaryotic-like serine/threonine-protein kinase
VSHRVFCLTCLSGILPWFHSQNQEVHMELWTEYEGITIDDAFPLKKLLLPEGRSAFFSTVNGKNDPRLIRLIACHFDEEEILARWRGVEALGHPNFLKLDRYGQLVLDKVPVIYAVLERVDANLAEVVKERRLTVSETTQLAASLTSALEALHFHGFVHEHVVPENVFAVGEVVKLRSDCIRETPEGEKGLEAKKRDIHDLSAVLLEALTQARTPESAARAGSLPAPFDQIVLNGMNGVWGIGEITAALQSAGRPLPSSSATGSSSMPTAVQSSPTSAAKPASSSGFVAPGPRKVSVAPSAVRPPLRIEQAVSAITLQTKWIGAAAFAICVLMIALWLGWHFSHNRPANHAGVTQAHPTPAVTTVSAVESHATTPPGAGSPASGNAPGPTQNNAVAGNRTQWRVVAYTYNHQDQAQKKSASIAEKHPELRPEVFTPTERAPYLVTIGGVMNRDQAFAFIRESRNSGLPRDTYAQNYSGNGR